MTEERNAIEEWVRWQVITAGVFFIDGGVYTLKYPYQTFPFLPSPTIGPVRVFGPANSTQFPFAANIPPSGRTLPIAGLLAMALAPILILLELDYLCKLPNGAKMVLYFVCGVITISQLTCVHPGTFLIFASICLLYNFMNPQQKVVLPK
jgi:hypothetical protein